MTRNGEFSLRLLVEQEGVPAVLRRMAEVCEAIAREQKNAGDRRSERWEVSAGVLAGGAATFDALLNDGRAKFPLQGRERSLVPGEPVGLVI